MPVGLYPLFIALGLMLLALSFALPSPGGRQVAVIGSVVSSAIALILAIPGLA